MTVASPAGDLIPEAMRALLLHVDIVAISATCHTTASNAPCGGSRCVVHEDPGVYCVVVHEREYYHGPHLNRGADIGVDKGIPKSRLVALEYNQVAIDLLNRGSNVLSNNTDGFKSNHKVEMVAIFET